MFTFRWWDIRNFQKAKDKFIVDTENKNPEYTGYDLYETLNHFKPLNFVIV